MFPFPSIHRHITSNENITCYGLLYSFGCVRRIGDFPWRSVIHDNRNLNMANTMEGIILLVSYGNLPVEGSTLVLVFLQYP